MNKDEPETALEYLKKVEEALKKLERGHEESQSYSFRDTKGSLLKSGCLPGVAIDPNYRASLFYNLACCYQRLGMLDECVDCLELATKAMHKKIQALEEEESQLLFSKDQSNADSNSIDAAITNDILPARAHPSILEHHYRQSTNGTSHTKADPKKSQKQTRERLLASKLHKLRYQCKFNLQLCAILSQLNQHRDALIYGQKSASLCAKLIKDAQLLCKRFMQQIQRQIKRAQDRTQQQRLLANENAAHQDSLNSGQSNHGNYSFT